MEKSSNATSKSEFAPEEDSSYAGSVTESQGCEPVSEIHKKSRWLWSLSVVGTSLAGAAVFVFRGCWHTKMSWPVRAQGYSYQVCTNCGIKRLFDEKAFRRYGPFSYDLEYLIAWEQAHRRKSHQDVA